MKLYIGSQAIDTVQTLNETEPQFNASVASNITQNDIDTWNGKSDKDIKLLTQAEYDALSDDLKNDGTIYMISDAGGYTKDEIDDLLDNIDLSEYAKDTDVVHKTGAETISGAKTFKNNVKIWSGDGDNSNIIGERVISITHNGETDTKIQSGYIELNNGIEGNTIKLRGDVPSEFHKGIYAYGFITIDGENVLTSSSLPDYSSTYAAYNHTHSNYITSSDLPDTSDMATKTWVNEQGFGTGSGGTDVENITQAEYDALTEKEDKLYNITDAQSVDITDYYTKDEVDSKIPDTSSFITSSDLPDTSDMATKTWVNTQGFGTGSGGTAGMLENEAYTVAAAFNDIQARIDRIEALTPDFSYFTTKTTVDRTCNKKIKDAMSYNLSYYSNTVDMNNAIYVATSDKVTLKEFEKNNMVISQAIADVNEKISSSSDTDLSYYYTKSEVDTLIPDTSSFITSSDLPDYSSTYAAYNHTHSNYITSSDLPDTSDMATKTWVNTQLGNIETLLAGI